MAHKRILLVDDDVITLRLLERNVERIGAGYQVVTATGGLAALAELEQRSFDLVVTDYNMPGMDGLELLKAIRLMRSEMPVIMVTAYSSDAVKAEARRLHVYRYLTKPFDINVFRQTVQEASGDSGLSKSSARAISMAKRSDLQANDDPRD